MTEPQSTGKPEIVTQQEFNGPGGPAGPAGPGRGAAPPPIPERYQRLHRKRSRIVPILLGLCLLGAFGLFALFLLGGILFGASSSNAGFLGGFGGGGPIAVLKIDEPIMAGPAYDFWMKSLEEIGKDDSIEGVIVRIDSPGGSVGASQEIYDEIINLRKNEGKTVYVSMGDLAASGGYYIAAAADRIFANRGTLTGSVGVISTTFRVEGLAEKAGVNVEVVKTGRFKDTGSMFRPMTEEDRKVFDLLLDDAYEQFIEDILAQREAPIAEALAEFQELDWDTYLFEKPEGANPRKFLLQIADGRVYSGEQALKLGLVDELGSLNYAIRRMAEDLHIKAATKVYEPRGLGLFGMMSAKVKSAMPNLGTPTLQYRLVTF